MLVSDIQVNMCKKLEETIHVHVRLLSQVFTFDLFNSNFFFQNLSCQTHCAAYLRVQLICECSLYASVYGMPILVKSDNVRSGRKAKAYHGRLWAAQVSVD